MFAAGIDIKIIFATLAAFFAIVSYVPYLRETFAGRTKPHIYTWLIWTLTTGTAAAGLWYGGGGHAAMYQTLVATLAFFFFLLCIKYGTKNITRSDTVILVLALLAIVVWWQLHSPLLAVLMATAIDGFAYLPTFRKTYGEPWSESMVAWVIFTLSGTFALLAIHEYNLLTVTYLLVGVLLNIVLIGICVFRRPLVSKPQGIPREIT